MIKGYEGEVIECSNGNAIVLKSAKPDRESVCRLCIFDSRTCCYVPLIGNKCCDILCGYWQVLKAEAP